ncbi:hypothetical protein [Sphingobacterium litopenaei]|uniref:Plasmid mobilization relaxosome protein MobC n=1 Tax=Sphingobacterium litopenaei TaxID=2763500 RepID=A0ABR7YFV5_9SPHI|nr:hypothetical protein [Sphingobacterium litopenaei]MBD1430192.1 hypothetical protein [Sphingobacterium litopenaei]
MNYKKPLNTKNKTEQKRRYYLSLTQSEFSKFVTLSKSLGMSKSKIVRLMLIENSDIMLYNTVELIKTLDFLGCQIAQIRSALEPVIHKYFTHQGQYDNTNNISSSVPIASIEEYLKTLSRIEESFRGLLKLTKKMK